MLNEGDEDDARQGGDVVSDLETDVIVAAPTETSKEEARELSTCSEVRSTEECCYSMSPSNNTVNG